jgi:hypothetical protein
MLRAGDAVPDVQVWEGPNRPAQLRALLDGKRSLLVFYLFDWSAT